MRAMKAGTFAAVILSVIALSAGAQTPQEWKLGLTHYGLTKAACAWYPGHLEFLDDDHLVVSAPVAYRCDKDDRDKPTETRISVIDLRGHELATVRRTDVVELAAGPIGYVTVCTGDRVELLSQNLQVTRSIAISDNGQPGRCLFSGGLSPSRTAMMIAGPGKSQFRLYRGPSDTPIAEMIGAKGQSIRAADDDGFLVCSKQKRDCDVVARHGVVRSFPIPQLGGASGYYIVGLVAPDKLLVAGFDGKHLYAETPTGETIPMGDIAKIKPPFIDSSNTEISATEPRRILYHVDGCLLGDFDDCYGVVFRRFAVFDSQTGQMIFRHSYAPGAELKICPDGHVVMEQVGSEVRLFRLP